MIMLTKESNAIPQKKLPPGLIDSGSFQIPCIIGNSYFEKASRDLEAGINLVPYLFLEIRSWRSKVHYSLFTISKQIYQVPHNRASLLLIFGVLVAIRFITITINQPSHLILLISVY